VTDHISTGNFEGSDITFTSRLIPWSHRTLPTVIFFDLGGGSV